MKIRLILLAILLAATSTTSYSADEVMTKGEYENYSVKYRCIEIQHVRDLTSKETALSELEAEFKLNEDNYEAFDEQVRRFEKDDELLDRIRERVIKECPQS